VHEYIFPTCGDFGREAVKWKINKGMEPLDDMAVGSALFSLYRIRERRVKMNERKYRKAHWLQNMGLCVVSIVVLALMTVVIACAKEEAPSEPEIPARFTTYIDEAGLFSISYPPDWEPALSLIEDLEQVTKDLIKSIEADLPVERASFIFFAGVPIELGYEPSVNILVESVPGVILTHDEVVELEIQGIKQVVEDYHEFSRIRATVGGREATIVDWEGIYPELGRLHNLQLFTFVGKVAWVVTCAPPAGEFSKWEDDFYHIVRSLRILK